MNSKRWFALVIAAVLFVVSIAFQAMSSFAFQDFDNLFEVEETKWVETHIEQGNGRGKVVVLDVNGVIQDVGQNTLFSDPLAYNHRNFISMLDHAAEDPGVEGIIIRVNSPGGGVVESDEVYNRIIGIKEEYEKPIYVSMGSMAASGGYYIAAPADKIYAHTSTITGSLGVIMQSINVAELADQFGVKIETIKSGPYKDIMSQTRQMTEEERQILQSIIDESYDQFVNIIATGRDLPDAKVRELADGRIYSGKQAVNLNLVDELGSYEDAIDDMMEEVGLGRLDVVSYEGYAAFSDLFRMSAQKMIAGNEDLLGIKHLLNQTNSPTLMYLYTESR